MVSYADFHRSSGRRRAAMKAGLHSYLGIPCRTKIYLDNGAFYFLDRAGGTPHLEYETFVAEAKPDWWPIPQDFIPTPRMTDQQQWQCFEQTMIVNRAYRQDGYVPVIHISRFLDQYMVAVKGDERLAAKPTIALGGIVPNLLRASKAIPYAEVLGSLRRVRQAFAGKHLHVFGVGGTATLHLAAVLGIDSADSSGWRNRAARGIVQLPGRGDRVVANLGSWRGRIPNTQEWELLAACACPACRVFGTDGLRESGLSGFCNRATHNLAVLIDETELVQSRLANGSYADWYTQYLENSIYLPLIRQAVEGNWGAAATGP